MIIKRIVFACLLVLTILVMVGFFISSCSSHPNPEREYAIAIAKQEAKKRGWTRVKVRSAERRDGHWYVSIERPRFLKGPGGDALVEISVETKTVAYHAGR